MSSTEQILSLLIAERDKLSRAIAALQGKDAPPAPISRSDKMKAYWTAKRAKAK